MHEPDIWETCGCKHHLLLHRDNIEIEKLKASSTES